MNCRCCKKSLTSDGVCEHCGHVWSKRRHRDRGHRSGGVTSLRGRALKRLMRMWDPDTRIAVKDDAWYRVDNRSLRPLQRPRVRVRVRVRRS